MFELKGIRRSLATGTACTAARRATHKKVLNFRRWSSAGVLLTTGEDGHRFNEYGWDASPDRSGGGAELRGTSTPQQIRV